MFTIFWPASTWHCMLITMAWTSGRQLQTLVQWYLYSPFLSWTWLSLFYLRHTEHLLCYLFFIIFSCCINLDINDEEIDEGKQSKSRESLCCTKCFILNSGESFQMVSCREKTIIYGEYLCPSEWPVGKKSYHWAHITIFTFFTWWARQTLKTTEKNTVSRND